MLMQAPDIETLRREFSWNIPTKFNIGWEVCDRVAFERPDAIAIIDIDEDEKCRKVSFSELRTASNKMANALARLNSRADRIGVMLPQCTETAVAHIAITKMGGISIPLTLLFGPEALLHRLGDSEARTLITNNEGAKTVLAIRDRLPKLKNVIVVGEPVSGCLSYEELSKNEPDVFDPITTHSEDPAILIYTSGTTGNPKGALHAHRVLLGHLPGVEMSHNFFPKPGDCIWTPADWAWIGGLLDVLLPALYHGVPVVARRFRKFTAEAAFRLIKDHNVQNAFLPPTALKMMRLDPDAEGYGIRMRSVASGGETLGKELIEWGKRVFGTTINEFYGQTECNMVVSSCADLDEPEAGVMGFSVPGHQVEILHEDNNDILPAEEHGNIAIKSPDPVMFLGYWNNTVSTRGKFKEAKGQKWLLTGDKGFKTKSGRICFVGRDDDVISSSGYRIGPSEIEDCLLTHSAVCLAGVVGMPDAVRGTIVAAYIQLNSDWNPSDDLARDIALHVRQRLAAYEAPRAIRFIDDMPMTTTGKIIRAELRHFAEAEVTLNV